MTTKYEIRDTKYETVPSREATARQIVGFSFYRLDPAWRRLPASIKRKQGGELEGVITRSSKQLMVLTYSLVGLKPDVDFLIWRVGTTVEHVQAMSAAVRQTAMAGYLSMPYAYLSMTKRSTYVDKLDPDHADKRRFIAPFHSKYLFIYPFVKTPEWYQLPLDRRQAMMDEHIVLGNTYPSVKIHTTYSFGLDDQEFVLAFETDSPQDFLDLVMAMRESKARPYTLRDTPIFTCVAKPFREILKDIGG
ncbi:MAG: chlorite dismutase family protein [Candidatus Omnitrophica bacterium]|nr:chlorite dismutase family protein [Candidatus Omnitrophota bacterium]